MATRVLVLLLVALAAFGGRADAAVDVGAPVIEAPADASPTPEAEAEEEAADAPVSPLDSDRRASDVRTAPPAGDWRAGPEVRPPRR